MKKRDGKTSDKAMDADDRAAEQAADAMANVTAAEQPTDNGNTKKKLVVFINDGDEGNFDLALAVASVPRGRNNENIDAAIATLEKAILDGAKITEVLAKNAGRFVQMTSPLDYSNELITVLSVLVGHPELGVEILPKIPQMYSAEDAEIEGVFYRVCKNAVRRGFGKTVPVVVVAAALQKPENDPNKGLRLFLETHEVSLNQKSEGKISTKLIKSEEFTNESRKNGDESRKDALVATVWPDNQVRSAQKYLERVQEDGEGKEIAKAEERLAHEKESLVLRRKKFSGWLFNKETGVVWKTLQAARPRRQANERKTQNEGQMKALREIEGLE